MDIRQLEYFLKIAKVNGFGRASEELHIAQSALSRQMRLLEDELGVQLMVRHSRGTSLTEAGRRLADRGEELLQQFRHLRAELSLHHAAAAGEVILGLSPSLHPQIGVRILARLRRLHPNILVRVRAAPSSVLREQLRAGALHLAILGTLDAADEFEGRPLMVDDALLIGAPGCRMPGETEITFSDIGDLPMITTSRTNLMFVGSKSVPELNVIMEVNSAPLVLDLVRDGAGYALMPATTLLSRKNEFLTRRVTGMSFHWSLAHPRMPRLSGAAAATKLVIRDVLSAFASELDAAEPPRRGVTAGPGTGLRHRPSSRSSPS